MTEHHRFDYRAEGNISRQRAWRNYVTNPQSLHPILKYDEHEENKYDQMAFPIRRTIEFHRFGPKGREIFWQFDIEVNRKLVEVWSRFIQNGRWLIITGFGFGNGDARLFDVDLNEKSTTDYSLPRWLDTHAANYGIFNSTVYFAREMELSDIANDRRIMVFGHLVKQNFDQLDKSRYNQCKLTEDSLRVMSLNHLFFVEGERHLRIGIDGLVHISLSKTEIYTIKLKDLMQRVPECEKRTLIDKESYITYTLPVINLRKFLQSLLVFNVTYFRRLLHSEIPRFSRKSQRLAF